MDLYLVIVVPIAVGLVIAGIVWTRRRAADRTAGFAVWSAEHGFEFDASSDLVAVDGLLERGWGRAHAGDTSSRAGTVVQTVLVRAGKHESYDLQVARVALRKGPATRVLLSTKPRANAALLAPLMAMVGIDHVHDVDDRLERRWIVLANDVTRAHVALAADRPLIDVLSSVQPPTWHKAAKDDGPWAIDLPETLSTWRNSRIDVEVSADEVAVTVDGRCTVRRAAALDLAERLAAAIDAR